VRKKDERMGQRREKRCRRYTGRVEEINGIKERKREVRIV